MTTRFSVVIPAYNEAQLLPRLLDSIKIARRRFSGGVEVIVADNNSTDRTAEIAKENGARVVAVKKRCIAAARNGGASIATGEILCFIDADSAVHPETFIRIDEALHDPTVVAGSTGINLERWSLGISLAYCILIPFAVLLKIDTGVVFCRKKDFDEIGGYNEDLLLAEDVTFLLDLKWLGRKRGQRLVRLTTVKALGSTRKFDEHGDWHYFRLLPKVAVGIVRAGFRPFTNQSRMTDITDYWYKPGR